jgi:hypothetical protein
LDKDSQEGVERVSFIPFYQVEPELAERETRTITVIRTHGDLPPGTYGLIESFCADPACDCRRVMLNVAQEEQLERGYLATISYAFDRDDDMPGPFLDPLNAQSEHSKALLRLVATSVLSDRRYVERLERHYDLVKRAAADPHHPADAKIQQALSPDGGQVGFSPSPSQERVPRSAPCPCGSGKKHKQCCMWKDRNPS